MSFHVDHKTQLFDDLTPREANELEAFAESFVLHGRISEPLFFQTWCEASGCSELHRSLVLMTAFPQCVLLSVLRARKKFAAE